MKTSSPSFFMRRRSASAGPASGSPAPDAGQSENFRRLILPHLDGAYNLARYLTRDTELSQDVVQDAALRAFRSLRQFRGGSARAWFFTIVRNCCRTVQAGAAGRVALVIHEGALGDEATAAMATYPDPAPGPEEEVSRRADVKRVRAAVEAIPEPFREVIVLREMEELSYAEIAEVTGVPIGTVMSRLSRGRSMLANELLPPARDGAERSRSAK